MNFEQLATLTSSEMTGADEFALNNENWEHIDSIFPNGYPNPRGPGGTLQYPFGVLEYHGKMRTYAIAQAMKRSKQIKLGREATDLERMAAEVKETLIINNNVSQLNKEHFEPLKMPEEMIDAIISFALQEPDVSGPVYKIAGSFAGMFEIDSIIERIYEYVNSLETYKTYSDLKSASRNPSTLNINSSRERLFLVYEIFTAYCTDEEWDSHISHIEGLSRISEMDSKNRALLARYLPEVIDEAMREMIVVDETRIPKVSTTELDWPKEWNHAALVRLIKKNEGEIIQSMSLLAQRLNKIAHSLFPFRTFKSKSETQRESENKLNEIFPEKKKEHKEKREEKEEIHAKEAINQIMKLAETSDQMMKAIAEEEKNLSEKKDVDDQDPEMKIGSFKVGDKNDTKGSGKIDTFFKDWFEKRSKTGILKQFARNYFGDYDPNNAYDKGTWGPMFVVRAELETPLPTRVRAPNIVHSDSGIIPSAMHRWASDKQIFSSKRRKAGGTFLFDVSGSMDISQDEIYEIMQELPASTIALYSSADPHGIKNENLNIDWWETRYVSKVKSPEDPYTAYGALRIVARDGRVVAKDVMHNGIDSGPYASYSNENRYYGNGNTVDGPALDWLARQPGPRIWVSDAVVTGYDHGSSIELFHECMELCARFKIFHVDSTTEVKKFVNKNPRLFMSA